MNIYHPYEVLADNDDCLHLKETEARERFQFVVLRVVPIFLLFFLWFVLQQVGPELPMGWNFVLAGVTLFAAGILFFKSYIPEIKILKQKEIFLLLKTFNGSNERTIEVNNIDKVVLKRKKGKAIGAFFYLHTKSKKSYLLLTIPLAYVDEHHIKLLKERLQYLLQVQVEGT